MQRNCPWTTAWALVFILARASALEDRPRPKAPERGDSSAHQHPTSSAPTSGDATNMERIVIPTLGAFNPSPEIKFPDTSHSMLAPVHGEAKIPASHSSTLDGAGTHLSDLLTPPHHFYHFPKPAEGYEYEPLRMPPYPLRAPDQHQHVPRPSSHLTKDEDAYYLSYDGAVDDDHGAHHQYLEVPPYPTEPSHPMEPAKDSAADPLSGANKRAKVWAALMATLTTIVPIGLFLAALPPNYVKVGNGTSWRAGKWTGGGDAEAGKESRGDEEEEYPLLALMGRYGIAALADPDCESRILCEMSHMGRDESGNTLQRVLWRVVNGVPDGLAELVGLGKLLEAAKSESCEAFKCRGTRGGGDEGR